jgi:hypothetical protein
VTDETSHDARAGAADPTTPERMMGLRTTM